MKLKNPVLLTLLLTAICILSCSKNSLEENQNQVEASEKLIDGLILVNEADFYLWGRDSSMHSVIKVPAGSKVSISQINGLIDKKTVPLLPSEEAMEESPMQGEEYLHVVYDNLDWWMKDSIFALECDAAVIIEKTDLYADSSLSSKIEKGVTSLKFSSLVGLPYGESLSGDSREVKIYFYDPLEKKVREAFISSSALSKKIDDIEVCRIIESLKITRKAYPRNQLFREAEKYKPSPKVLALLNDQKVEKVSNSYKEAVKSMQKMSFGVNVDELLTVDQSKDPFR